MTRDFNSPEEEARYDRLRELVAAELPELIEKHERTLDAAEEPTLSGELRRAIHGSDLLLPTISARSGVSMLDIDYFLAGDAPLPSDALDRLAATLGCSLPRPQPVSEDGPAVVPAG